MTQMRNFFIVLVLVFPACILNGQIIEKIAGESIEDGITNIERLLNKPISDSICLIGVGDVSALSRQSVKFNTALISYLISKKGFRQIFLIQGDWLLRPLREYLGNDKSLDTDIIDSLMAVSLVYTLYRTKEFKSFLVWLKEYNLQNRDRVVDLLGVGADDPIPISYFLSTYIVPFDKELGLNSSKKWHVSNYTEDQAWADIKLWYGAMLKDSTFLNNNSDLMLQMKEDIERNDQIKNGLSPELGLLESANDRLRLISSWVLGKMKGRAIFYSHNEYVAKSKFVLSDTMTVNSPGLFLHNILERKYYASLTDFQDSAFLNLFNPEVGEFKKVIMTREEHIKRLFQNKEASHFPDDSSLMGAFTPKSIGGIAGQISTSVLCPGLVPADAIFFFQTLTPTTFINSFKVKYTD